MLDLVAPSYSQAFSLTQETRGILYSRILPVMDGILSWFAGEDEVIHLDQVELDLGTIAYWELEEQFVERIRFRLEEVLAKNIRRLRSKTEEQVHGRVVRRCPAEGPGRPGRTDYPACVRPRACAG